MGHDQLNAIIDAVKGDPYTKDDARKATVYYKYKKDFAVLSFGDQSSLVHSKMWLERPLLSKMYI